MKIFIHLFLLTYASFVSCLIPNTTALNNNSANHFSKKDFQLLNNNYFLKSTDYICSSISEISDETFTSSVNIKSDTGCQSIKITNCQFNTISIPDSTQSNGQISIIYIKNSDFLIETSTFQECSSLSEISIQGLDSFYCHAIYIDENLNHKVSINGCNFLGNGNSGDPVGTLIFSNKADNIEISFSQFKSDTISTRAFQSYDTSTLIFSSNTFSKMIGPKGQNGGALLIQLATDVSITDCIFDSNALQPGSSGDVSGSAFYINLKGDLTFTNNTISNHQKYLNSVITFNKNEIDANFEKKILISDSKFNNNQYTSSFDGSGIGFYSEDYSENLEKSYHLHIVFSGCQFNENGDASDANSAGVFGWSRGTSIISFVDCQFKSNKVSLSSSLINIQNGCFLDISDCNIEELTNYCFLKFSPFADSNPTFSEIQVKITNNSFINTDTTNRIKSDFILFDKTTKIDFLVIIEGCQFTDISLDNYIIHCKSNFRSLQLSNSTITFKDRAKGSNAIYFETSNIEQMIFNNCIFERAKYGLSSNIKTNININDLSFDDCHFTDCKNGIDGIIYTNTNYFSFNNGDFIFSSNTDASIGIFVSQTIAAFVSNTTFKNCQSTRWGVALKCNSQEKTDTSFTVNSCIFDSCVSDANVCTTSREVNFINNSITASGTKNSNGLYVERTSKIFVDQCKFTRCSYNEDGSSIRYYFKEIDYDKDVVDSIIIQNCYFTECKNRASVIYAIPYMSLPKIINTTIIDITHSFNIIIYAKNPQVTIGERNFLLQNVSFINVHPVDTGAEGGGGIGFWFETPLNKDSVSFIDCHFENTYHAKDDYGGGAICIQNAKCKNYDIQISGCSFKNCSILDKNGGAIAINTSKTVQIENCYLEKCRIESNTGNLIAGAIYVNQESGTHPFHLINVTFNETTSNSDFTAFDFECEKCNDYVVRDCNFINCKSRKINTGGYNNIISCPLSISKFECINSNFIFDKADTTNPRAIRLNSPVFSIYNCSFVRCGSANMNFGGGFFYDGDSKSESASVEHCLFDECLAYQSGAFRITLNTANEPTLNNNTIKNVRSSFTASIEHKKTNVRTSSHINNFKFIGNYNTNADGGGGGFIAHNYVGSDNAYGLAIYFNSCEFINNFTPNNGGGFGVGSIDGVKLTELDFRYCNFTGNSCNGTEGGGALWIRTSNECRVLYCNFDSNCASRLRVSNGGAIYLSFTSDLLTLSISNCKFNNNSCIVAQSSGHAVYSTLLYGCISISRCNFSDNGFGIQDVNSIIYTRSVLSLLDSFIYFTDKENSFSRALYVGASSDLTFRGTTVANCTAKDGSGASLYYTIIRNRLAGSVDISDNTFINNTGDQTGTEVYLKISSSPLFYNCTFINENSPIEIVAVVYEQVTDYSTRFDRFCFINCNFNYKNIYYASMEEGGIESESITFFKCEFSNCSNIYMNFKNIYSFEMTGCIFKESTNNDYFSFIKNVQQLMIKDCVFKNNTLVQSNSSDIDVDQYHATILVSNCTLSIINTLFEEQNNQDEDWDSSNCFIIKTDSNLELEACSFINSPNCKYAISYLPPLEIQTDNLRETIKYPSFSMNGCLIDNSGAVLIENATKQISIINSIFSNSENGLIYYLDVNLHDAHTDNIRFENNTFDGFTNRACLMTILNGIELRNCTIKNCVSSKDENCNPFFELDFRNETIVEFLFDSLIFINNSFYNLNTKRWMNGGGTGLMINLDNLISKKEKVFLNFVDCGFISNCAESYGGGFAFIEDKLPTFLSFDCCYFKGNSCKKLKGSALYLIVKNVSIINCIFEENSKQKESEEDSTVFLSFIPLTTGDEKDISDSFSLINCSFLNNGYNSFYFDNNSRDLIIANCTFCSNHENAICIKNSSNDVIITDCEFYDLDDQVSDFAITCNSAKSLVIEEISIENSGGININYDDTSILERVVLGNVTFDNCNNGFFFNAKPKISDISISITECVFSSAKHALFSVLLNDNFVFSNNSFINCTNLDKNVDKSSIIELNICSSVKFVFDKTVFANNKYLHPKESASNFGGGIGLNVFNSEENKKSFKVEFNQCEFSSNEATDGESKYAEDDLYSGGVLYYVDKETDTLLLSSLSLINCIFTSNYAIGKGGALYIETKHKTAILISNCFFRVNKAEIDAAAIFVRNGFNFELDISQFVNNSVSHNSVSTLLPTDSLIVEANANAVISNTVFIKSSYANLETNIQAYFSILRRNSGQISIQILNCAFSSINPSKSLVSLRNLNQQATINTFNSSYTHFYLETHIKKVDNQIELSIINQTKDYIPVFIYDDLVGKIIIDSSCFDAGNIYTFDKTKVGFDQDTSTGQIQGQITNRLNQINSHECFYPPVIDEIMKDIFDSKPSTDPNDMSKNMKYIIIWSVVGAVALVLIIVVIIVIVLIKRKKKKQRELEEKERLETEKANEMTEENELLANRFFATQIMTQENPLFTYANNTINNNNISDDFYEESK